MPDHWTWMLHRSFPEDIKSWKWLIFTSALGTILTAGWLVAGRHVSRQDLAGIYRLIPLGVLIFLGMATQVFQRRLRILTDLGLKQRFEQEILGSPIFRPDVAIPSARRFRCLTQFTALPVQVVEGFCSLFAGIGSALLIICLGIPHEPVLACALGILVIIETILQKNLAAMDYDVLRNQNESLQTLSKERTHFLTIGCSVEARTELLRLQEQVNLARIKHENSRQRQIAITRLIQGTILLAVFLIIWKSGRHTYQPAVLGIGAWRGWQAMNALASACSGFIRLRPLVRECYDTIRISGLPAEA